jgi:hypothetical protein
MEMVNTFFETIKRSEKMEINQKRPNLITKIAIALLATFILSIGFGQIASYELNLKTTNVASAADLKSQVKANNVGELTKTVDNAGSQIVDIARQIAIVVAIVVIIWGAYSLFIKKSAEGLADMKGRMGVLFLALAMIFFTEKILGAVFGLLGVKI